jgi:hypothetical protein
MCTKNLKKQKKTFFNPRGTRKNPLTAHKNKQSTHKLPKIPINIFDHRTS